MATSAQQRSKTPKTTRIRIQRTSTADRDGTLQVFLPCTSHEMYPLRFEPLFRRYLWGGRRLAEILDKPIGDQSAAESWEIVDHDADQSIVRYGDLAGSTLRQLIAASGEDLVGKNLLASISSPELPAHLKSRFPLLLKFLDAHQNLSVQVHPNDAFGATLEPPDLGKTEAWYVMHADPGARIYAGLKLGVTRSSFVEAVEKNVAESVLHSFEAKPGDCIFVPAGTIHAIGAGLLIAEVQQASNTTFRVYDWDRVDVDGQPRPLHLANAVEVIEFERGPVWPESPRRIPDSNWQTVLKCEKFILNRGTLVDRFHLGGDGQFRMLAVTQGEVSIADDPSRLPMRKGDTALLPACLGPTELRPSSEGVELLEISVPEISVPD